MARTPLAHRAVFAAAAVAFSLGLAACEEQGPAEELGEKIDEGVNDAKRAAEDATD